MPETRVADLLALVVKGMLEEIGVVQGSIYLEKLCRIPELVHSKVVRMSDELSPELRVKKRVMIDTVGMDLCADSVLVGAQLLVEKNEDAGSIRSQLIERIERSGSIVRVNLLRKESYDGLIFESEYDSVTHAVLTSKKTQSEDIVYNLSINRTLAVAALKLDILPWELAPVQISLKCDGGCCEDLVRAFIRAKVRVRQGAIEKVPASLHCNGGSLVLQIGGERSDIERLDPHTTTAGILYKCKSSQSDA